MTRIFKYFAILLTFTSSFLSAYEKVPGHKTICVNMIVKNETKVITRCLGTVKPIIDYWVIVDTGSTDGTQELIKDFMKDVPGELHERPWVNFGHNRTEALELAKGKADYILVIDADETLRFDPDFKLPDLDQDLYYITTEYGGTKYARIQLVNNHLNWKWQGVLHETLESPDIKTRGQITGMYNVVYTDGARSTDPQKYQKDAALLEKALIDDPTNTRYVFYLAQSYRDAGDLEPALKNYEKRIALGGWDQEIYWSMLQAAILQEGLNMPEEKILKGYYDAYNFRPTRAEAINRLANYYRRHNNYASGYLIAKTGLALPVSKDALFVEQYIYDYNMKLECSICAYWIGRYAESKAMSEELLAQTNLPQNVRECVDRNLAVTNAQLAKINEMIKQNAPALDLPKVTADVK